MLFWWWGLLLSPWLHIKLSIWNNKARRWCMQCKSKYSGMLLWCWGLSNRYWLVQEVPTFCDFWFQRVIMNCKDHEVRGTFFSVKPQNGSKNFESPLFEPFFIKFWIFWIFFYSFFFHQNLKLLPEAESENSRDHELWNHKMGGSPVIY